MSTSANVLADLRRQGVTDSTYRAVAALAAAAQPFAQLIAGRAIAGDITVYTVEVHASDIAKLQGALANFTGESA